MALPAVPPKLRPGDQVRVVAPSRSMAIIGEEVRALADSRFAALGLTVTYGERVLEMDDFASSSVSSRVADLHSAFGDPAVAAIWTVIGGFNVNQLLPHLDWDLIAANPKILCGYSDITALQVAGLARAGLVTYSGPHWSTLGMRHHLEPTLRWCADCLFRDEPLDLAPSPAWSDDPWYLDQEDRHLRPNDGWWVLGGGEAAGQLVGGNLCTLTLLQGTPFLPRLAGVVLFLEDDEESRPHHFDRHLTSLLQERSCEVRGLVVGRFQEASGMTRALLEQILASKPQLAGLPVVANVDIGHTNPLLTFPVGGQVEIRADAGTGSSQITVTRH